MEELESLNRGARRGDAEHAEKSGENRCQVLRQKWKNENFRATALRWLRFNAVGAVGIGVQLAVLAGLRSELKMGYLSATALAVEVAVIHNYFWHERFTWVDRETGNSLARFAKFNLTTGLFSVVGNLVLMRVFVGGIGMNYLVANLVTIATCSVVNFVVSDRVVFE